MGDVSWQGTTPDPSVGSNWSSGSVPTNGDRVFLQHQFNNPMSGDAVTFSAKAFSSWNVDDLFTAAVGGSGAPVVFSADTIRHAGEGDFYWRNGTHASSSDLVIVASRGGNIQLGAGSSNAVGRVILEKGNIDFEGSGTAAFTVVEITPRDVIQSLLDVTFTAGMATTPDVYVNGGKVTVNDDITNMHVANTAEVRYSAGSLASLFQSGGMFYYDTSATLTLAAIMGGLFDASQDARAKTIITLKVLNQARANLDNGANSITVTNPQYAPGAMVIRPTT